MNHHSFQQHERRVLFIGVAFIVVSAILMALGCVHPAQAEIDTYRAVAPEYRSYVEGDQSMSPESKELRYDLLKTWAIRVGEDR